MSPIQSKFVKSIISVLLVVVFISFTFVPQDTKAQDALVAGTITAQTWWQKAEAFAGKTIRRIFSQTYRNFMRRMLNNLAVQAAKKIATGQKGKLKLFPGEGMLGALENEFYASVGNFLEEYDKMFGGLLCNPDEALKFAIAINLPGVQGGQMMGPTKSKCDLRDVKGRWKKFGAATSKNLARKDFNEYVKINMASQFDEGNNDFGVFLKVNEEFQKKTGLDSKQNLLVSALEKLPGYQGISDAVKDTGGRFLNAPGTASDFQKNVNQGIFQEMFTTTQDIVVDAMNVFTNTLISEYLKRLLADPAFKNPATSRGTYRNFRDLLVKPTGTEQETFIEKSFAKPVIYQSTSSYDPLADLVSCPDDEEQKTSLNCSMTQELHEAVRMKEGAMTLKQAIEEGAIKPDAVIGFMSKGVPPSSPDQGFSEDALINLRKFRILPVGFELVASEIKKGNIVAPVTIKQALDCFDPVPGSPQDITCKTFDSVAISKKAAGQTTTEVNPLRNMVDPNWVITIPDMICKAQVYGKELQSPQSADRRQYCADVKDCVARNEKGTCLEYGNCLTEVSTWTFKNGTCPSQFASCESWTRESDGKEVSYIMDSVDSGKCSENSGGCGWLSLSKDSSGYGWTDESRIYLNRDAQNDKCSYSDAGCKEYRSLYAGTEVVYNGDFNISKISNNALNTALNPITYGDDVTIPDGWSWNSSIEYSADRGSNNSKSVRFTNSASIYQDLELVPSSSYQLSAFVSGGGASVSVYNRGTDGNETTLLTGNTGCDSTNARITSTGQCIFSTGTSGSVRVKLSGSGNVIIDSVSVVSLSDLVGSTSYISYEQNPKVYLKPSSKVCDRLSVGCAKYDDVEGGSSSIFAVTKATDMCPVDCVGFNSFEEVLIDNDEKAVMTSIGEVVNPNNTITRFFSPNTAAICQATEVGCEEYTNLSVSQEGGESLEYYNKITSCVSENQGTNFYTWEGSDNAGFVIKVWNILKHSSGRPCTSLNGDVCAESNTCANTSDPSCRTFYNDEGSSFNIDVNKLVFAVNDCREYRRTRPNIVSTGGNVSYDDNAVKLAQGAGIDDVEYIQPILKFSPSLSMKCSASSNGCHEYRGTASSNVATLPINGSFETGVEGWSISGISGGGVRQSAESIATGGRSLEMNDITGALIATLPSGSVKAGDKLSIDFWAKVGGDAPQGGPAQLEAENTTVVTIPVSAGVITEDNSWHRYTLNTVTVPSNVTDETPIEISFDFGNTNKKLIYIDTVSVKRTIDSLYLVANSWDQELTSMCINFVGCREYKTGSDSSMYAYKFDRLCKEEFVGCDAVVNTHNSSVPYAQIFNTDTVSTKDNYLVAADSIEYRVIDDINQCSGDMVGCTEVGAPTIDKLNNTITQYTTGYIKIRPDYFDSNLCSEDTLFCESYSRGPNKVYFKDPGNNVCTYIENVDIDGSGIKKSGWYKQGDNNTWFECLPGDVRTCSAQFDGCSELLYKPYVDKNNLNLCYGKGGDIKTGISSLLACEGKGGVDSVWCSPCTTNAGVMTACVTTQACPSGSTKSPTQVCVNSYGRVIEGVLNENECVGAKGMWEYNSSYYVLSDRFTFEGCGNNWSEEDGCVQFFNKSNVRERVVIKADLDRQCTSWLACRDSAITVGSDGRAREICNKLGTCTKYNVNNPSKCDYSGWAKYECVGGKCDNNPSVSCTTNTECESVLLSYSDQDSKYREATNGRWGVPNYSGASIPDMYPISRMTQVVYDGVCVDKTTKEPLKTKSNPNGLPCVLSKKDTSGNSTDCFDNVKYTCSRQIKCFGEYPCNSYDSDGNVTGACSETTNPNCLYEVKPTVGLSYVEALSTNTRIDKGINNGNPTTNIDTTTPVRVGKQCRAYPESNSPFAPEIMSKYSNVNTYFEHKNYLLCRDGDLPSGCITETEYNKEKDLYQNADCSYAKGRSGGGQNVYMSTNYTTDKKISANNNDENDNGYKISGISVYQGWKGYCLQSYPGMKDANCAFWYPVDVVGGETDISSNAIEAGLAGQPYGNRELSYCVDDENMNLSSQFMNGAPNNPLPERAYYCLKREDFVVGGNAQNTGSTSFDVYRFYSETYPSVCKVVLEVSNPTSSISDLYVNDFIKRVVANVPTSSDWNVLPSFDYSGSAQPINLLKQNCSTSSTPYKCYPVTINDGKNRIPNTTASGSARADLSGLDTQTFENVIDALQKIYTKGTVKSLQRVWGANDDQSGDIGVGRNYSCEITGGIISEQNAGFNKHNPNCVGSSTSERFCVPSSDGALMTKLGSLKQSCLYSSYYPPYYAFYYDWYFKHEQTLDPERCNNCSEYRDRVDTLTDSSLRAFNLQKASDTDPLTNEFLNRHITKSWDRSLQENSSQYVCKKYITTTTTSGSGPVDTNLLIYKNSDMPVKIMSYPPATQIIKSEKNIKNKPDSKEFIAPYGTINKSGIENNLPITNTMCRETTDFDPNSYRLTPAYNICTNQVINTFSVLHSLSPDLNQPHIYNITQTQTQVDKTLFAKVFGAYYYIPQNPSVNTIRTPNPIELCSNQYNCTPISNEIPNCLPRDTKRTGNTNFCRPSTFCPLPNATDPTQCDTSILSQQLCPSGETYENTVCENYSYEYYPEDDGCDQNGENCNPIPAGYTEQLGNCTYYDTRLSGYCQYTVLSPGVYVKNMSMITDSNILDNNTSYSDSNSIVSSLTWPVISAAFVDGDQFAEGPAGSILVNNRVLQSGGNPETLDRGTRDVVMRFFGFSPKGRHMPLLGVWIDWDDGTFNRNLPSLGSMSMCSTTTNTSMPVRCFDNSDCPTGITCSGTDDASIKNKRAVCDSSNDEWGGTKQACDSQIPFTFAHTYTNSGTYNITIRLYDNWGFYGQVQKTIVIPEDLPVGGASGSGGTNLNSPGGSNSQSVE